MSRSGFAVALVAASAILSGCGPSDSGRASTSPRKPEAGSKALSASAGPASSILGLSWGGPISGRWLAALRLDGRIDLYRPDVSSEPLVTVRGEGPKPSSVVVLGGGAIVSGDASGLAAWLIDPKGPRKLGRLDSGGVTRLIGSPGEADEGYAGLDDGSVVRFRLLPGDLTPRSTAEFRPESKGVAVRGLALVDSGRGIAVRWADGRTARLRRDLVEAAAPAPATPVAEAEQGKLRARLFEGPSLVLEVPGDEPVTSRIGLGRSATSLAFAGEGRSLVVGETGQFLVIDLTRRGPIDPASPRVLPAAEGPAFVAADPEGVGGRVALGDASGRLMVVAIDGLASESIPRPLDEIPELAFLPWKTLRHPRTAGSRVLEPPLPAEGGSGTEPGPPDSAAILKISAEEHARAGRAAREADLRRWRGRVLIPDFEGPETARDPRTIREGVAELARASALYEQARPPLIRQARLCDAERAWGLLCLGESRASEAAIRPAIAFARTDPVLSQAPEFEAIVGALAASAGDWPSAVDRFGRLLNRLGDGDRRGLRARAALGWIGSLTASGRIREASDWIDRRGWDCGDPEVRLRALTARVRAGRSVAPGLMEGRQDIHFRGRLEASEGRLAEADGLFAEAAEGYERIGRPALAAEAVLERAEALERRGIHSEAQGLYESIVRSPQAGPDRSAAALRPIGRTAPRASRGLARCLLAAGRAEAALTAIEQASIAAWFAESGEAAARSSPLALPAESAEGLGALRKARSEGGPDAPSARDREAELASEGRLIVQGDPTAPFDPSGLRLAEVEAAIVFVDLGPESIVGFLIRRDRPIEARQLPLSRSELSKAIASWRASLGDGGRGLKLEDEPPGLGGLATLSEEPEPTRPAVSGLKPIGPGWDAYLDDALIRPFEDRLQGVARLIVVPTGEIAALPIEAVGRGSRLLSRFRVSYMPSLWALQARRAEGRLVLSPGRESLWVCAPGSPRPAGPAAGTLVVAGPDARPSRLFGPALGDCRDVRITAPATLDPARMPWGQPDLRLAEDGRPPWTDGRLTSTDLLRLPLRAGLLVLDVGDPTARGSFSGRGLVPLALDGLAAGAETVLVGLWDVPPGSSIALLDAFRSGRSEGLSPSDAIDRARRVVAGVPATRDPVHWAGYVLYGPP